MSFFSRSAFVVALALFSTASFAKDPKEVVCRQSRSDSNENGDTRVTTSWGFNLVRLQSGLYNLAYTYSNSSTGEFINDIVATELKCTFDNKEPSIFSCDDTANNVEKCAYVTTDTGDWFYNVGVITKRACAENASIKARTFHQTRGASGCFAN